MFWQIADEHFVCMTARPGDSNLMLLEASHACCLTMAFDLIAMLETLNPKYSETLNDKPSVATAKIMIKNSLSVHHTYHVE